MRSSPSSVLPSRHVLCHLQGVGKSAVLNTLIGHAVLVSDAFSSCVPLRPEDGSLFGPSIAWLAQESARASFAYK